MKSRSLVRLFSSAGMLLAVIVVFGGDDREGYGCGGSGGGHWGGYWGQHWRGHWRDHGGGSGGSTWYVRTTGSDWNDGTSAAQAFRTISRAEDRASAGDTIYVGAGTYNETVWICKSGRDGAYLSFIADTTGEHTGDKGTVIVAGSGYRWYGFYLRGISHVRIAGFEVTGARRAGIHARYVAYVVIDKCHVHDSRRGIELKGRDCMIAGCHVYNNSSRGVKCDGRGGGAMVIGCVVYGNRHDGVEVKGIRVAEDSDEGEDEDDDSEADDGEESPVDESCLAAVYNCYIYANGGRGIKVTGWRTNVAICNNTVVLNGREGAHVRWGSTGRFINNIFAYNGRQGISRSRRSSAVSDYNLFWQNRSGRHGGVPSGDHDVSCDPLFRDLSARDFRLTNGSPARGAGLLDSAPSIDFQGQARKGDGKVDIGADEFGTIIRVLSWTDVIR